MIFIVSFLGPLFNRPYIVKKRRLDSPVLFPAKKLALMGLKKKALEGIAPSLEWTVRFPRLSICTGRNQADPLIHRKEQVVLVPAAGPEHVNTTLDSSS
jgi:hypothetical protein